MELREAAQRIFWHYKLLALALALGLLVPWALTRNADPTYVATMRVLVSRTTDSAVSADTVAAIATSRTQLGGALTDVGADRNPDTFASKVSVRAVGSSGMVDLSVTDRDAVTASAIANALTARVVQVMRDTDLAKFPLPSVIDSASPATVTTIPPTRKQDIAFGGLLGLVVGVVIAALLEALSPTMIGKRAIAAELHAPVLGVLPRATGEQTSRELPWVRYQLGAQAERSGVATVELTTVGPSLDLTGLALALHEAAPRTRRTRNGRAKVAVPAGASEEARDELEPANGAGGNGRGNGALKIRVLDRTDRLSFHSNGSAGIVIVTPTVVKRADMESTRDLLGLTGWPAVGVIAYRRSRLARGLDRLTAKSDPSAPPSRMRRLLPWSRRS